jgi:outer membrane biosynthesis protein TonB
MVELFSTMCYSEVGEHMRWTECVGIPLAWSATVPLSPIKTERIEYMKLSDIIALAKAGYKPSEVKELLEMAETDSKEEPTEPTKPNEPTEPTEPKDDKKDPETSKEPTEPDYKALYEETEKKLKEAQKENRKDDASGNVKTDEETALNYINSIFK